MQPITPCRTVSNCVRTRVPRAPSTSTASLLQLLLRALYGPCAPATVGQVHAALWQCEDALASAITLGTAVPAVAGAVREFVERQGALAQVSAERTREGVTQASSTEINGGGNERATHKAYKRILSNRGSRVRGRGVEQEQDVGAK